MDCQNIAPHCVCMNQAELGVIGISVETETLPNPANRAAYQDAFQVYSALYHALKPVYNM